MPVWLLVPAAYLIGAIPFGFLIGRLNGIDVRRHGSGNIGATNVGRVVGRAWGRVCLVLDLLKGFIPALVAALIDAPQLTGAARHGLTVAVAAAAVIGHVFPIYLGFRGGKGVATMIGVSLGVWPHYTVAILIALAAYAAGRAVTGVVSVGSLLMAVSFPIALMGFVLGRREPWADAWPLVAVAVFISLLVVVRHKDNIARLRQRREFAPGFTEAP